MFVFPANPKTRGETSIKNPDESYSIEKFAFYLWICKDGSCASRFNKIGRGTEKPPSSLGRGGHYAHFDLNNRFCEAERYGLAVLTLSTTKEIKLEEGGKTIL